MNTKIIDIRYGRVNRRQFLLAYSLVFFAGILLFISPALNMISILIFLPLSLYLTILILARRLRDTGYSAWYTLVILIPVFIRVIPPLLVLFFPPTIASGITATIYALYLPSSLLFGLIIFMLLIAPGSLGPNKYGYPPTGLNFMSMVSEVDTGAWKKQLEESNLLSSKQDVKERELLQKMRDREKERLKNSEKY